MVLAQVVRLWRLCTADAYHHQSVCLTRMDVQFTMVLKTCFIKYDYFLAHAETLIAEYVILLGDAVLMSKLCGMAFYFKIDYGYDCDTIMT